MSRISVGHLKQAGQPASTMRSKTFQALVLILLVAVLLRVTVAIWLGNEVDAPPLLTDQRSYHALGVRLSTGHGFSFDRPWYPFYLPADSPTAHWSYLYSLFVAAVYSVFGPQVIAARLVQAILGGIVLLLAVYQLTRRMLESASSTHLLTALRERGLNTAALPFIAAGIAAIYFYFVLYAATLMTETFFITALLWALDRAIALADTPTLKNGLALGVGLAAATLLRQSVLPGPVCIAPAISFRASGFSLDHIIGLFLAGQPGDEMVQGEEFEGEGQVTAVAQHGHFEKVETVHIGDGINPFREAEIIP